MITSISIENFKGIGQRVTIPLKPITLLFGPNSAGKSTILHAIQYAADVLGRNNLDADRTKTSGDAVDLGGFRNFVHGRRTDRLIRLAFEFQLGKTGSMLPEIPVSAKDDFDATAPAGARKLASVFQRRAASCQIELAIGWSNQLQTAYVAEYIVSFDSLPFARIENNPGRRSIEVNSINFNHPIFGWHLPSTDDTKLPWGWPDFSTEAGNIEFRGPESDFESDRREHIEKMQSLAAEYANPLTYWIALALGQREAKSLIELRLPILNLRSALPAGASALEFSQAEATASTSNLDDRLATLDAELAMSEIFTQALVAPCDLLRKWLSTCCYIGPIREKPQRAYQPPKLFDQGRWASGLAAWDWLYWADEEDIELVNNWLTRDDRLAIGYEVVRQRSYLLDVGSKFASMLSAGRVFDDVDDPQSELEKLPTLTRVRLRESGNGGLLVEPSDVGEGVAQLLPVVVALVSDRTSLLMIEQPELHVHPRIQVGLGDLLIERMDECQARVDPREQFPEPLPITIIETHSEHLLLRLLRRIRETTEKALPMYTEPLKPDELAVLYVESSETGTSVRALRVDESGEFLDPWPDGFFEERGEELFG